MDIVFSEISQIQKSTYKWVCCTWFHLYKVQQLAYLINVYSSQNRGYLWVGRNGVVVVVYTEKEHKRTLEGVRNALYLDLHDGFKGLCTHKNYLTVLKMIVLSAFC